MKRIISFCLCFMLTAALLPVGAMELYEKTIMQEDFEGSTPLMNFEYTAQVETVSAPADISEEAWGGHGTALSAVLNSGKQMAVKDSVMSSHQDTSNVNISFDLMLTDYANLYIGSWLYHSTGGPDLPRIFSFTSGGKIELWQRSATNSTNYAQYQNYELNRWYSVSLFFDFAANSYSLYLDGNEITVGSLIYPEKDYTRLYKFRIDFGSTSNGNYLYLDNFRIARPLPLSLLGQSLENNVAGVMVNDSVSFSFNNLLDNVDTTEIVLTAADGTVSYPSAYSTDKMLTVTFADSPLAFDTEYTLTVGKNAVTDSYGQNLATDVSLHFKTMKSGLLATLPRFVSENGMAIGHITEGQAVTVQSTVYNYTDSATAGAALLVGVCDEAGCCTLFYQTTETDIAPGGYSELTVTVPAESVGICTIKAICVADLDTLTPILNSFSELTEDGANTYLGAAVISEPAVTSTSVANSVISAEGAAAAGGLVLLAMRDEENTLLAVEPLLVGADGSFSYRYYLSDVEQGVSEEKVYSLSACGWQGAEAVTQSIYYINDVIRTEICNQLNSAKNADEAGAVATSYRKSFNLPENRFCAAGYMVLYEQRPYAEGVAGYHQAVAMLDKAYVLLEKLNNLEWSEVAAFLAENETIVLKGYESSYEIYAALTATQQNAVNQAVLNAGVAADFETFRTNFAEAVKKYRPSQGGSGDSSHSNGSVGGGRGNTAISLPSIHQPKPENMQTEGTQTEEKSPLSDLHEAEWAREAVESLVTEGIISGYGDGSFRPNDSVKREEFLKMLVLALGIDGTEEESTFADTVVGAWYLPYLSIGQTSGIVRGNHAGYFGVGYTITREDAAVMLWRALQKKGSPSHEAGSMIFADEADVSDYAKEAIENLTALGIFSGMSDGSFAPRAALSRAQAAKILFQSRTVTEG